MTGRAQDAPRQSIVCCVCTRPISLETSKTDEQGKAVHESCYVRKTISRFRRGHPVYIPEHRLSSQACVQDHCR